MIQSQQLEISSWSFHGHKYCFKLVFPRLVSETVSERQLGPSLNTPTAACCGYPELALRLASFSRGTSKSAPARVSRALSLGTFFFQASRRSPGCGGTVDGVGGVPHLFRTSRKRRSCDSLVGVVCMLQWKYGMERSLRYWEQNRCRTAAGGLGQTMSPQYDSGQTYFVGRLKTQWCGKTMRKHV